MLIWRYVWRVNFISEVGVYLNFRNIWQRVASPAKRLSGNWRCFILNGRQLVRKSETLYVENLIDNCFFLFCCHNYYGRIDLRAVAFVVLNFELSHNTFFFRNLDTEQDIERWVCDILVLGLFITDLSFNFVIDLSLLLLLLYFRTVHLDVLD